MASLARNVSALFILDPIAVKYLVPCLLMLSWLSSAGPIHQAEAVTIGGIQQWIQISGADDQAPVLLFIHGGPGNSVMSYADRFTTQLKQHFIVVLWDQRLSGKTATLNKFTPVSVGLLVQDTQEVVRYLSTRFNQHKIYVMGHSWGGYLALRLATEKPQWLKACLVISPMIHQEESEKLTLSMMKQKAIAQNDQVSLDELNRVRIPFEDAEQLYIHRKGLSKLMNTTPPTRSRVQKWADPWLSVFNEATQTNFLEVAPRLECPTYFLIGRNDYQTYFKLTENYYQKADCPEKKLYWFEQSAHNPHLTETPKFEQTVIDIKNLN